MKSDITLLRAVGIILVVFGHSDICYQRIPHFFSVAEEFVYSFHMPLFIFISGFVFIYTNMGKHGFRFAQFIRKKTTRLLVPAFFVLTIAFFLRAALSYSKGGYGEFYSIINYFKMFILKAYLPIEFFWFIFTLFNIFLLSRIFLYCIKERSLILILTLILIAMNLIPVNIEAFYLKYTSEYLIYFWFGCLCCFALSKGRLADFLRNRKISLILQTGFLFLFIYFNMMGKSTPFGKLICAISGIFLSYSLVQYLSDFKLRYLRVVGEYSYQIFLLSWFFQRIVETIGFKKFNLDFWATFPLSFLSAVLGPILLAKMLEIKARRLNFVLGMK